MAQDVTVRSFRTEPKTFSRYLSQCKTTIEPNILEILGRRRNITSYDISVGKPLHYFITSLNILCLVEQTKLLLSLRYLHLVLINENPSSALIDKKVHKVLKCNYTTLK